MTEGPEPTVVATMTVPTLRDPRAETLMPDDDKRCREADAVWDRRCERPANHTDPDRPLRERVHRHSLPGDVITWGSREDMRAYYREEYGGD